MAYPNSRLRRTLARAFTNADSTVIRLRRLSNTWIAQMAAEPVTASLILDDILAELKSSRVTLVDSRDTSGILAYARDQFDDVTIDLPAEFTALIVALDTVITWVVDNFPTGTGDFLQRYLIAPDGTLTDRSFSSAQTAGLRTQLQALSDSIE